MLKRIAATAIALVLCVAMAVPAFAAPPTKSYYYNTDGIPVPSPLPYTFVQDATGLSLMQENPETGEKESIGIMKEPSELVVGKDDTIYILDTGNNRIVLLDEDLGVKYILSEFNNKGEILTLNGAKGLYVYEYDGKQELYVSDTENKRIIHCDMDGNVIHLYTAPVITGVKDDTPFYPQKILVDRAGRMYVLCRTINRGIVKLGADGDFDSFYGCPPVTYSLIAQFWRKISTQAQLDRQIQFVPTEYSNITMDSRGFIYATTTYLDRAKLYDTYFSDPTDATGRAAVAPVRKLALDGTDILVRNGIFPPVGDVSVLNSKAIDPTSAGFSQFGDITVSPYDAYTILDQQRGRIFTYDTEGNLLFVFGNGNGIQNGTFNTPVAISYYKGNQIVVLDQRYASIQIFRPTDYGETILDAVAAYQNGEYELSEAKWSRALEMNSNMNLAYTGAGKARLRDGNYREAMANFKISKSLVFYSTALDNYMKELIGNSFSYVFIGLMAWFVIAKVVKGVKRFRGFLKDGVKKVM